MSAVPLMPYQLHTVPVLLCCGDNNAHKKSRISDLARVEVFMAVSGAISVKAGCLDVTNSTSTFLLT